MIEVSIIIPCRNEERYISQCLNSLVAQNYPKERLEILVVDGSSEDRTRDMVKQYVHRFPFIRLLNNPRRIIPSAMNIGIANAKGDIVMKMDAHASYPKEYVSKCVSALKQYNADNVGGIIKTMHGNDTLQAKAIALALSHSFGVGSSPLRKRGLSRKPRLVDTVAFGCYKREVFEKIGLYNENLARSSDMELNIRLKKNGGKILLASGIVAHYYADPTLAQFWKHNFIDGIWAIYPLKFTKKILRPRHLVPFAFIASLLMLLLSSLFFAFTFYLFATVLVIYIFISLLASLCIALKEEKLSYLFIMPVAFAARHFGYGIGSLWGLIKLAF